MVDPVRQRRHRDADWLWAEADWQTAEVPGDAAKLIRSVSEP